MGTEIERKFLLASDRWLEHETGQAYKQGYIANAAGTTVRVRIAGEQGVLTLKGRGANLVRPEYEYQIPLQDAEEMLELLCAKPLIVKTRYKVTVARHIWDVDVFHGANEGLKLAEVELQHPNEAFEKPAWLGDEVTGDQRYFNAYLVNHPYSSWL